MALSTLEQLRVSVADRRRLVLNEIMGVGDGVRRFYQLQMVPVTSTQEVVSVNGAEQARNTDYTIDYNTGLVTFMSTSLPGVDLDVVAEKYIWTAFSNEELQNLLDKHDDNVVRASIDVVRWLLMDTERFMKYFLGQEMIDRNIGVRQLRTMLEEFENLLGAPAGLVVADTADLEDGMAPFIEQPEGLFTQ